MESHISPKDIQERVETLNAAEKPEVKPEVAAPEVKPEVKAPEVKPAEPKAPEVKAPEVKAPEVKPEAKVEPTEKKQPNDPAELRKWATKAAQEAAAANERIKKLEAAIAKLAKKPVDYEALAKDPEALKKHVEAERAEAAAEMEKQLTEERTERVKNETVVARLEMERDAENYPRWGKLFPLIQNLAGNQDGRINFARPPREVLHDLYILAEQLSPSDAPASVAASVAEPVAPATPAAPMPKMFTEEEMNNRVEAARKEAAEKAQAGLSNEANGAGLGSAGKGGRRSSAVSKEALAKMDLKELKKLIAQ
jgi:hypothetical protein